MHVSPRNRALAAGVVWLIGGSMLLWRGSPYWMRSYEASPTTAIVILLAALIIGGAKGWFVLRKSSARMIRRIEASPVPRPIWEIYPVYFYPLILVMIGMGWSVRHYWGEDLPGLVAGVYLGIGAALLTSSAPYFKAWRRFGQPSQASGLDPDRPAQPPVAPFSQSGGNSS